MSDDLSQQEADYLFRLEKKRARSEVVNWPALGKKVSVALLSLDEKEQFVLDVERSYVKISKLTVQNRARTTVILARLDIDGAPHRNPDDSEVPCPHLHLYREGYNDKWAVPVPLESFSNLGSRKQIIDDFMRYCSIIDPPEFREDLLS